MMRRRLLFSYDITDDQRRAAVFGALLDEGDHVQYSVFLCELTSAERIALEARLSALVDSATDQILVFDLGPVHRLPDTFLRSIGKSYRPPTRATIV